MEKNELVFVVWSDDGKKMPCSTSLSLNSGDKVVVESEVGLFLGRVVGRANGKFEENVSKVLRIASEKDLKKFEDGKIKAKDALKKAKERAQKYNFEMKLVGAQYTLDFSKIIFTFSSESRVDFRDFVKELASLFKVRIELKQIGSRDECKVIGGLGVCGKMCCCKEFLPELTKVSIKMAKNQNISLNPQKINGLCGRLMCCLSYENEDYVKVMSKMPKIGSEVSTKQGKGVAVYNDVLGEKVSVKFTDHEGNVSIEDFDLKDVKVNVPAIKE